MNRQVGVLLLSIASVAGLALIERIIAQEPTAHPARTPVVVELFTSEGCSSCPPADQLLTKLEAEQPVENAEIIALEQHVDYWDNGSWTDPFSSNSATTRQYDYARALGNGNAYTPQMVVDGQAQFVGSSERQARGTIERAGGVTKIAVTVTLAAPESGGVQTFRINVGAVPVGDTPEIWMAITETGLHSNVRGGENAGEDLHHAAVVRKMKKIDVPKSSGNSSFATEQRVQLDRGWKRENSRLVVFVQDKRTKKILGAAVARFPA
jgi:hypothetical protein